MYGRGKSTTFERGKDTRNGSRMDFNEEFHHGEGGGAVCGIEWADAGALSACNGRFTAGRRWLAPELGHPKNFQGRKLQRSALGSVGLSPGVWPGRRTGHSHPLLVGALFQRDPSPERKI